MTHRLTEPFPQIENSRLVDCELVHRSLANFNFHRLAPSGPREDWHAWHSFDQEMQHLEHAFITTQIADIRQQAAFAPHDAAAFSDWFLALEKNGPGQGDALFPWLAEHADWQQMRWFLTQEAAGEAGFDDLVALSQLKLPIRPKLEMARNYWDEMGRGHAQGMHGRLLAHLVEHLELKVAIETTVWQSLALGNLMVGLANDRQYAYHAIGALGVIELTAPSRVNMVNEGLKRLGVAAPERRYFELHATLDIKHAKSWMSEVLVPLVNTDRRIATWLAEGALMRLSAGQHCFATYRTALMG